ncbi:hypothetical protein ACHAXS_013127 [Conticribra weissflogii]
MKIRPSSRDTDDDNTNENPMPHKPSNDDHANDQVNRPSDPSSSPTPPRPPPRHRLFEMFPCRRWIPPLLLSLGLATFTKSFFLSRTSFRHRSICDAGAGGNLLQSSLGLSEEDVRFLRREGWLSDVSPRGTPSDGCWTSRRVDSLILLVVDALRFDFARDHLPLSIGSRLSDDGRRKDKDKEKEKQEDGTSSRSRLFQFVADPPTVTMQRLKGLTTGGLPTFADIGGSFGGASVDEDSWVEQLKTAPWSRRSRRGSLDDPSPLPPPPQLAFVGDDTWVDLFPTQFDDSHPYPSFNTRDLDTVDDGCLGHLPRLLRRMVGLAHRNGDGNGNNSNNSNDSNNSNNSNNSTSFELIVAHFLGVDHVGHTYGPNDPHMTSKLHQMDVSLAETLDAMDAAPSDSCVAALVLGDHGMTEDGNHGGGTSEEINAGLFAHFSPGCGGSGHYDDARASTDVVDGIHGSEIGKDAAQAFESINQIDLVPTISLLLGLPIPYANIGGLVPALLPKPRRSTHSPRDDDDDTPHIAVALALNAAQVWSYLHEYSKSSRDLPSDQLKELKELLDSATMVYSDALAYSRRMASERQRERERERENDHSGGPGPGNHRDSIAFRQACGLFKLFLAQSTDLGKRVWTQFNETGMMAGIGFMAVAWLLASPSLWTGRDVREDIDPMVSSHRAATDVSSTLIEYKKTEVATSTSRGKEWRDAIASMPSWQRHSRIEIAAAVSFMTFQCAILTFSNSYIEHEREVVTFSLSVLCLLITRRWYFAAPADSPGGASVERSVYLPLSVAICSRLNDVFVSGHGLDPSIRLHPAHHSLAFLTSLALLLHIRLRWMVGGRSARSRLSFGITSIPISVVTDAFAMFFLACTWWEKRARDHSRNGFIVARAAMGFLFIGLVHSVFCIFRDDQQSRGNVGNRSVTRINDTKLVLFQIMMLLVMVTGPSCASTAVLVLLQCASMCIMMESCGSKLVRVITLFGRSRPLCQSSPSSSCSMTRIPCRSMHR